MRLMIGGDVVPTETNRGLFAEGSVEGLLGRTLADMLDVADYSVFNLEVPLTDVEEPIAKNGPNLIAPTATARGVVSICRHAVGLANNHILDQGVRGLQSTVELLDTAGVAHLGAGENLEEASRPLVVDVGGVCLGLYACAEHEFSIAGEHSPGANPYDPLISFDAVRVLAQQCDHVVVLYHGGKEHYRYPSPQLRRVCRKFAECGASLVVCQHSHCIGCAEEWVGATVVYGQGNFLFDHSESEFWKTSLLLDVELGSGNVDVRYVPLIKCNNVVRAAEGEDAEGILSAFKERSRQIAQPGFVDAEYTCFAEQMLEDYLDAFIPGSHTLAYRVANRLLGRRLAGRLTSTRRVLRELNFIECETHRELFERGLENARRS